MQAGRQEHGVSRSMFTNRVATYSQRTGGLIYSPKVRQAPPEPQHVPIKATTAVIVAAAALESRGPSVQSAAGGGHPRSARVENSQNRAELPVITLQRLMRGNLKAADLSH